MHSLPHNIVSFLLLSASAFKGLLPGRGRLCCRRVCFHLFSSRLLLLDLLLWFLHANRQGINEPDLMCPLPRSNASPPGKTLPMTAVLGQHRAAQTCCTVDISALQRVGREHSWQWQSRTAQAWGQAWT